MGVSISISEPMVGIMFIPTKETANIVLNDLNNKMMGFQKDDLLAIRELYPDACKIVNGVIQLERMRGDEFDTSWEREIRQVAMVYGILERIKQQNDGK